MNKLYIFSCAFILGSMAAISHAAPETKDSKSVVYYADPTNHAETQRVLEECKSRIKTVFDYEIVMSQENCKNAQIGEIAAFRKQQRDEINEQKNPSTADLPPHLREQK